MLYYSILRILRHRDFLRESVHVGLGGLHEEVGVAGVADKLHAQITPLHTTLHGVGEAAQLHALGVGLGDDALDALHHLGVVDLAYVTQGAGEVIGSHEYHVHAGDVEGSRPDSPFLNCSTISEKMTLDLCNVGFWTV